MATQTIERTTPRTPALDLGALFPGRYLSVTSFKRDGTGVATPVWAVSEGNRLFAFTDLHSAKVRRVRHDPHVLVAPCLPNGTVRGEPLAAHAEVLTAETDLERVQRLMLHRYRISYRFVMLFYRLGRRLRGKQSVADGAALAIVLDDDAQSIAKPSAAVHLASVKAAMRRRMYRRNQQHPLTSLLNRGTAALASAGLAPARLVTLEVRGRRSGRCLSFPVVIADVDGKRYLVAMLGEGANWPRNVRAAGGRAVLRHRHKEAVRLEEVAPDQRAAILRRYVEVAPGGRAHIPVDPGAPLTAFERIAAEYPVFRIEPEPAHRDEARAT